MSERTAKQIIVMRKDLNMRKGKMVAQGAHASLGAVWLIEELLRRFPDQFSPWTPAYEAWRTGSFTKVCVHVSSAEELHGLQTKADVAGLPSKLIVDSGLTEFGGVPTETCLAIGPSWADELDPITGKLPLL